MVCLEFTVSILTKVKIIINLGFQNQNAEPYFRWVFRKNETLNQVVFYFLSQVNATSPRFFPLFEASSKIRIVYIRGLRIPHTDLIMLKVYKFLFKVASSRFERYDYIHIVGGEPNLNIQNQILHLDDPNYSIEEKYYLQNWERFLKSRNLNPIIICTNNFTSNYLSKVTKHSKILIIEQGFDFIPIKDRSQVTKTYNFSCVYSSPYIHVGRDKHSKHGTWGAELLIKEIIPLMYSCDPDIEVHLVGELGKCAKQELKIFDNLVYHGRVNFYDNLKILARCSIGIYPRDKDLKRSMSKIFSYIGAGLPMVVYDLYDTEVVKRYKLGFSVKSSEEFVEKIIFLKRNPRKLQELSNRVNKIKPKYSWQYLSKKMESQF